MLENQLQEHNKRIDSAASRPQERTAALQSGIEWADDAIGRLDDDEAHATSEFHRRKSGWKRNVAKDEKPRLILEQTRLARTFRVSGWLAICIELVIATLTLLALLVFGLPFWTALAVAFLISTVVTIGIAYVLHGGITALVARWDNPLESYQHLKQWFVFPSFMLMILSVLVYVAAQRMDAQTVYYLQPAISVAKFTAMLGFMVLGTALLVAADSLDWSRSRAVAYGRIRNWRQRIVSKRGEWHEELDHGKVEVERKVDQTPQSQAHAATGNGNAASVPQAVATMAPALLLTMSLLGLSACTRPPQIIKASVREEVSCELVIDASGIRNREALREAGLNVLHNIARIVQHQHANRLSVFWFGRNGWTAEEKLALTLPDYERLEVVKGDRGELEKIRPDVGEIDKQRNENSLKEAEADAWTKYSSEVEKAIVPLTLEVLLPPSAVESPCTDVNGMMSRFVSQPKSTVRDIVLIVTDGRQNCGQRYDISNVSFTPKSKVVVIVLVPGTDVDGHEDFELRRSRFSSACSQCVVVPYYRTDLDQLIAQAFENTQSSSLVAQK